MTVEVSHFDERQLWLPAVSRLNYGWPSPARLAPLVRWAGGKRWILPLIGVGLHARLCSTGGRLVEPFAGGAAVASWLGWPRTAIGDACRPLADLYAEVIVNPEGVSDALDALVVFGYDEESYRLVRAERPDTRVERAAWALYLNRTCFNGLWRENAAGGFNVPFGKLEAPAFPSRDHVAAWSARARAWQVHSGDFGPLVDEAGDGDAIFADPPYADGTKGGFSSYVQGGWRVEDRRRLAAALGAAARRGALVVATDGGSDGAREDYETFGGLTVVPARARHSVGASGNRRGNVREWIAVSDPAVLG